MILANSAIFSNLCHDSVNFAISAIYPFLGMILQFSQQLCMLALFCHFFCNYYATLTIVLYVCQIFAFFVKFLYLRGCFCNFRRVSRKSCPPFDGSIDWFLALILHDFYVYCLICQWFKDIPSVWMARQFSLTFYYCPCICMPCYAVWHKTWMPRKMLFAFSVTLHVCLHSYHCFHACLTVF